jgi:hypothetical protein
VVGRRHHGRRRVGTVVNGANDVGHRLASYAHEGHRHRPHRPELRRRREGAGVVARRARTRTATCRRVAPQGSAVRVGPRQRRHDHRPVRGGAAAART